MEQFWLKLKWSPPSSLKSMFDPGVGLERKKITKKCINTHPDQWRHHSPHVFVIVFLCVFVFVWPSCGFEKSENNRKCNSPDPTKGPGRGWEGLFSWRPGNNERTTKLMTWFKLQPLGVGKVKKDSSTHQGVPRVQNAVSTDIQRVIKSVSVTLTHFFFLFKFLKRLQSNFLAK